jgi:thymidylate synthase (FAD)
VATIDDLKWKKFPVLDDGFVALVDVMGDDAAICQAARVSYGAGTRPVSDDRTLIRYLMRHRHATPFEMAEIKLLVRVPMDAWRQWIRHRTANVNEYSTRYSEAIDSAQKTAPDAWRSQATANKQGSAGAVAEWPEGYRLDLTGDEFWAEGPVVDRGDKGFRCLDDGTPPTPGGYLSEIEASLQSQARHVYEERIKFGVAREQARKDLPLSTYTEAYWKCDLRNVLGFLALRMDSHAQAEIRAYAEIIGREIVAPLFPETWSAFEDYTLASLTLSRLDIQALREVIAGVPVGPTLAAIFPNAREREECRVKLARLNIA